MTRLPRIATLGAATIDAFVWSRAFSEIRSTRFSTGVGECFSLGSKIDIERFVLSTGGGATNAGATFANLGFQTSCACAVGDDLFGRAVREDFRTRGIGAEAIAVLPGEQTAFSTILVMPSGERTVLVHRGASEKLTAARVPWKKLRGEWLYMTSVGGRMDVLKAAMAHAARAKMRVFWNPGGKDIAHGLRALKPYLRGSRAELGGISVLSLNREEAATLTGRQVKDTNGMLRDLHMYVPGVVFTDGSHGAWWSDGDRLLFAKPTGVKAVNRTGAGDAFGSGFLSGFVRWSDPAKALQLATLNAESVIQKIGAKTGLLRRWPSAAALKKIRITVR